MTNETRTTSYTWENGLLKTVDGPRTDVSDVTTYADDPSGNGNLVSITNALGQQTTFPLYDVHGRPTRIVDANGTITDLQYDVRGRLSWRKVAVGEPEEATTGFEYDKVGNLIKTTLPNATFIKSGFDAAHRIDSVLDSLDNLICYTLDEMGNRTEERTYKGEDDCVSPASSPVREFARQYNTLNRLEQTTGGAGQITTFEYDHNGNQTERAVDPAGVNQVTVQEFDELNRLDSVLDAENGTTGFGYDARDNLTEVTDPKNLTTTYEFDAFDDLTEQASPDTGTTTFEYDSAGNRIEQIDARPVTTTYAFDALNRLTSIDYPDNTLNVSFTYDTCANGVGRLCLMDDGSGETEYAYDARGNLIAQEITIGAVTRSFTFGYDKADLLTSITYPSGRIVTYVRDAAGRIDKVTVKDRTAVQTLAENIDHVPFGPVAALSLGNALAETRGHDLDYRLSTIETVGSGVDIQDLDYSHAPTDNVTGITDHIDGSRTQAFTYDKLNRLKTANAAASYGSLTYSYDSNGNRLQSQATGQAQPDIYHYAYQNPPPASHRLLEITNNGSPVQSYEYDNNGNTTANSSLDFVYGDHNRLLQATAASTPVGTYTYNGRGERVKKVTASATRLFFYGPEGQVLSETDGSGGLLREYVYLEGRPLAMVDGPPAAAARTVIAEFQVNNNEDANPWVPRVDVASTGQYVAAWAQNGPSEVWVQRFSGGAKVGGMIQVQTGAAKAPDVAYVNNGNFVVVLRKESGSNNDMQGRIYKSSDGTPVTSVFTIANAGTGDSSSKAPRVAYLPIAGVTQYFVTVWQQGSGSDINVYASLRKTTDGSEVVAPYQVNSDTVDNHRHPSVRSLGTHNHMVVWSRDPSGSDAGDIWGRRMDSYDGSGGTDFQVNTTSSGTQDYPGLVQLLGSSNLIVAWKDAGEGSIRARRITEQGAGVGNDFRVDGTYPSSQGDYALGVGATADGGYFITWETGGGEIAGRFYDKQNQAGAEFIVNTSTTHVQKSPGVGRRPVLGGSLPVVWLEDTDGDGDYSVRGKQVASSVHFYYHTDHLQTPQIMTNAERKGVWSALYEPFGEVAIQTAVITNNLRFPGQYFDVETGLHHNGFRDLEPTTGRYIQSDPIGLLGGLDAYGYVGANPIIRTDILGLAWYCTCRASVSGGFPLPDQSAKRCKYTCRCNCEGDLFPFIKKTFTFTSETRRRSSQDWDRGSLICHGQGYDPGSQTATFSDFGVSGAYRETYPDVYDVLNQSLDCDGNRCSSN